MAAVVAVIQAPGVHSSAITTGHLRVNVVENTVHIGRKSFAFTTASAASPGGRRFITTASRSPNEEAHSNADDSDTSINSKEDLNFLLKLGAGSFAGAAAIKYGSVVVPEITRPNITQALIMISTPVLVAVLILIRESRVEQ